MGRLFALTLLALLAVSSLMFQLCWAQSTNQGAIVGTITDENGAVVRGVRIIVTNVDTKLVRNTVSNDRGDYRIDFLPPGRYSLTAERAGFKKVEITDLNIEVGQLRRIDITLPVGQLTEEVTVSSEGAPINTETAAIGAVIDSRMIQNLPLNGREFIQLAALVPGAESGNPKRGAVYSKGHSIGFNGARAQHNAYTLDGADSTDAHRHELISSPALDAIKEFRVVTNMYSAQYGRSGGAIINVVTESGTNNFHGSLYEYHRNKRLDAAPVLDQRPYNQRPPYLFNQFGGSLGGPVILPRFGEGGGAVRSFKNKTFFFVSAEWFRQKKPGQMMISFAPTDKERAGDLSSTINPWTGQPVVLRNPFTGEIIPSKKIPENLINPVGKRLMDLWPKPNYSGDPFLNLRIFRSGTYDIDKWLLRLDHNFSDRDTLSATFNYNNYDNVEVWHTPFGDKDNLAYDRTLVVTYTHVFSAKLANDLKFNHTWYKAGDDFLLRDKNYAKEWGIYTESTGKGSPRILMYTQGYQRFDIGNAGPNVRDNKYLYIKDTLVWTKDNHTISMGGDFKREAYNWLFEDSGIGGTFYFGLLEGAPGFDSYYLATGSVFSSLLMGVTPLVRYGLQEGQFNKLRRNMFALFVQDDWKVRPKLTLNLGLRYDYEPPFSEINNRFATLNFETGKVRYAKGAPKLDLVSFPYEANGPNRPYEPSKLNFAPRVGFAFRPFNNNRTAIRGGYGIFYTSETAFTTVYGSWVAPFAGQFTYSPKAYFLGEPQDHFVTIDKKPYRVDEFKAKSPGFALFNAPYYPTGYIQQWNLTVARDLGRNFALELAYVGSKGTNLEGSTSLDFYSQDLLRKVQSFIPGFSPGIRVKGFNSKYNSFQGSLTKRFSHGLSFLASFTWSHAMAESSNDEVVENILFDANIMGNFTARRYSNADFDVPLRFSLSGIYELPFGKSRTFGKKWSTLTDFLIGNWTLNYIFTLQSGFPFTVYTTSLRFPDRICDGNLPRGERSPDRWFDYRCFPTHQPSVVIGPNGRPITIGLNGNAGPNIIRGPGINNLDLGLHKNFRFNEKRSLQLRVEAFNALNHPNFIGPSGNYFFNTPSGAKLTRARDNRDIQLAIKFLF